MKDEMKIIEFVNSIRYYFTLGVLQEILMKHI